jgi:CHAT domain-containing protein
MGENWYDMGDLQQATQLHRASLQLAEQIDDLARKASALKNLSRVYFRFEEYLEAETCISEAISLARSCGDSLVLADCLRNWGLICWLRGFFRKAMSEAYAPALQIYRALNHRAGEAVTLSNIGLVHYQQQDYRNSLAYQKQALAIQEEIGDRKYQAESYFFIAITLYRLGQGGEALQLFRKAYELAKAIDYYWTQEAVATQDYKPLGEQMAERYKNMSLKIRGHKNRYDLRIVAMRALWQGRYDEALAIFRQLLPMERQQHNLKNLTLCHTGMGQCFLDLGQLDSAKVHFLVCKSIVDSIGIRWSQFESRYGLGQVAEMQRDWRTALTVYQEAAQYSEEIHEKSGDAELQASWSGRVADCHLAIVRMLVRLGNEETNKTGYYWRAFRYWQASMARQFNQRMTQHDTSSVAQSENDHFGVFNIQQALPAKTCYLGHLVNEDQTFVFAITATDFDILEVPIKRRDLEGKVELARVLMEQMNYSNGTNADSPWRAPLKSLYDTLIRPVQSAGYLTNVEHLVIMPSRVLHHLPFACLIGNEAPRPSKKSIYLKDEEFFLVEHYDISYLPSAAMLGWKGRSVENHRALKNATWLVLAPFPDRFHGTRNETETIMSQSSGSGKYLSGTEATEASFKTAAPNYDFIHLATHSYLAVSTPESTYVKFQPEAGEDGFLTVTDILQLKLNANLVVLSSCESGMSTSRFYNPVRPDNSHPSDEFIGLTRAFLVAGAKQVLSTLWPVQDGASAEFMGQFYRNLAALPPAMALAATQRHFIAKKHADDSSSVLHFSHPYIWGAYLVVGVP